MGYFIAKNVFVAEVTFNFKRLQEVDLKTFNVTP